MKEQYVFPGLFEELGIAIPIFQAPIGASGPTALAIAISNAGGVGALALSWQEPADAASLVAKVRQGTDGPFLVNFVLSFGSKSLEAALEAGAPIVTFSWGIPSDEVDLVRSHGAKFGVQVSTLDGAKRALEAGADFLICQGVEAGGHVQSTRSLWTILPAICAEAGDIPVIAAGGLTTGRDFARAINQGSAAVMMGTRFLATQESVAHPKWKEMLVSANNDSSVLTVCFDIGWPYAAHRVLRNTTLERWEASGCPPNGRRPGEGDILAYAADGVGIPRYSELPPLEGMTGSVDELCLYAGAGCDGIHDIPSAGEVVSSVWAECLAIRDKRAPTGL